MLPTLRRLDHLHRSTLLVSTSRTDRSGRVHERILLRELGWNPGSRVDMDTRAVISGSPHGGEIAEDELATVPSGAASAPGACGVEPV